MEKFSLEMQYINVNFKIHFLYAKEGRNALTWINYYQNQLVKFNPPKRVLDNVGMQTQDIKHHPTNFLCVSRWVLERWKLWRKDDFITSHPIFPASPDHPYYGKQAKTLEGHLYLKVIMRSYPSLSFQGTGLLLWYWSALVYTHSVSKNATKLVV